MEQFAKSLSRKLILAKWTSGLSLIVVLLFYFYHGQIQSNETDFVRGFQLGVFIGIQLLLLKTMTKTRTTLKNPQDLRSMYIKESDERTRLITDKSNTATLQFGCVAIGLVSVIAGFFSPVIAVTLACTLLCIALLRLGLKRYYQNQF